MVPIEIDGRQAMTLGPALRRALFILTGCSLAACTMRTPRSVPSGEAAASVATAAHTMGTVHRNEHGDLLTAAGDFVYSNDLVRESSPYLLQHAHEPVRWMPWGEAAFAKARAENKPVFLSIGYSTCHWCHVMARESFSDETVAALLNRAFVPIKVDREERPDVDDVYMTAVQIMTHNGGWPLSVWLTPQLEPFRGATYLPKTAFLGQLSAIARAWTEQAPALRAAAANVATEVRAEMAAAREAGAIGDDLLSGAAARLTAGYDEVGGGFGQRPKFPNEATILFLLDHFQRAGDGESLRMALGALDAMQAGGIHDQVGGGFARYSTDAAWLVPHFEKMLYNQAWLGRCYLEAFRLTRDPRYRRTAQGILRYVTRDLSDPAGGFYAAEDADSGGQEGRFYLWTASEMTAALGEAEGKPAIAWYGVTPQGNFPELPGSSILTARQDPEAFAATFGIPAPALSERVDGWQARLVAARALRPRPRRDDKILTDWNGMMIGTLARAATVLEDPAQAAIAERAASFVLTRLRDGDGRLQHAWAGGAAAVPAFLDDDAALLDGLLELHEATGKRRWLDEAEAIYADMRTQFRDPADGAFARTGPLHERLLARAKDGYDGALPSGNALAAWSAVRLWRLTGKPAYREDAEGILRAFADELRSARGAAFMLRALDSWRNGEAGTLARSDTGVVAVRAVTDPVGTVAPGATLDVSLELEVAPGWHVLAGPPAPTDLLATEATVAAPFGLEPVAYPPGRRQRLPFDSAEIRLYEGRIAIPIRIRIPADMAPGLAGAHVDLRVQACDDRQCLAPETLRLELPVRVAMAGE